MYVSITVNLNSDEKITMTGEEVAEALLLELGGDPDKDYAECFIHVAEAASHGTPPGELIATAEAAKIQPLAHDDAVANDDAVADA